MLFPQGESQRFNSYKKQIKLLFMYAYVNLFQGFSYETETYKILDWTSHVSSKDFLGKNERCPSPCIPKRKQRFGNW